MLIEENKNFVSEDSAPFLTAVFDLECNSSIRRFSTNKPKVAQELYEYTQKTTDPITSDLIFNMLIQAYGIKTTTEKKYPISHFIQNAKPVKKFLKFKSSQISETINTRETYAILARFIFNNYSNN